MSDVGVMYKQSARAGITVFCGTTDDALWSWNSCPLACREVTPPSAQVLAAMFTGRGQPLGWRAESHTGRLWRSAVLVLSAVVGWAIASDPSAQGYIGVYHPASPANTTRFALGFAAIENALTDGDGGSLEPDVRWHW